ncbi:MAG TPA: IPTL-CTERM sorting domain-containing protein [Verrucomicrobiae bacterium]|nr:IPTL-CTERM sorting domain-containing protein [Verrucomicrobiae bacterium]
MEIRQAVPIPSLTTYGLIALALLLAGTAVWMFRRRRVNVAV